MITKNTQAPILFWVVL